MKTKGLFLNRFNLIRELGEGSYGMVMLAQDMIADIKVALKIVQKSSIITISHINRLRREINLLRLLKHPNIVNLYSVIETFDQIILVMEYIPGGDLFDLVIESGKLDENTARKVFRQLFSAVLYCHDNMMVHRDLKPENMLLDENNNLKIIDFGFVKTYSKESHMTLKTYCGSYYYCAPEMFAGTPYPGPASDIWSLGVILYVITNGYLPFRSSNVSDLYESVRCAKYDKGEFSSPECNRLIEKMIVPNPSDRMNLSALINDPWLNDGYDTVLSPICSINNELLKFREEVSEEIDNLELIGSSIEKELKKNGLRNLSLFIPIANESGAKSPTTAPSMEKCVSDSQEYNTELNPIKLMDINEEVSVMRKDTRGSTFVSEEIDDVSATVYERKTTTKTHDYDLNEIKSINSKEETDTPQIRGIEWKNVFSRWFHRDFHEKAKQRFQFLQKK